MTASPANGAGTDQAFAAPHWGGALTENDYVTLSASWITRDIADAAMLRRVDEYQGREVVGQKGKRDCAGILFPYYWPGEPGPINYRIRRDNPEWTVAKDGKVKPDRKYLGAPNSGNRLYIPPGVTLAQLADAKVPIVIVEGEKKALAVWRLAWHETETPRFIPVAIAGVWSWRGKVGRSSGPRGERIELKGPIPDLGRIEWKGRTIFIVFDADVQTNENVNYARNGIARELASRHADVQFVNLPEDCGAKGVDDLLAAWGPATVLELFERSVSGGRLHVVLPPQYQSRPEGMFRVVKKGEQLSETQLSNYRASIKTSITLDDGLETKREFEIESELMGRAFQFRIPASQFTSMEWPIEQMGSGAITYPSQKEYARTAIQSYSLAAEERCIYTHTGWREVEGKWLFLNSSGAVGEGGTVPSINVRLSGSLARYELRLPASIETLKSAVRSSLRLVELGPPAVSFALRAATCRAVLGACDFSIHLTGQTGAFKSELAALEQQHFGAGMSRLNLPGAWSSTANSLEVLAFHAKDALITIDDFAPQGNAGDISKCHAAAERLFRAAGNHAGRGRLDSTARLRDSKPPRGLILSTGEEIPRGHSLRARMLILELAKGAVSVCKLTECQREAAAGVYAEAMGAFVRALAGRYEQQKAKLERRVGELRVGIYDPAHARTPDIIANLQAAWEMYLEFACEYGAISHLEQEDLARWSWEAFRALAADQAKHHAATEPTARFLTLVRACLTSGRAHLETRQGTAPDQSPGACGWRESSGRWSPLGDCIGWVDGEDLYLEPAAAYMAVQVAGRDGGESLSVSGPTLHKRLKEKGLLKSTDTKRGTLTVRRTIAGSQHDVLHFFRRTLLPEEVDE